MKYKISKIHPNGIIALLTLIFVPVFWKSPLFLTLILAILSMIMLINLKSRSYYVLYILCFILGTVSESVAIYYGAWSYSMSNFAGIPYWLPFVWGIIGIFIKRLSLQIEKIYK